MINEADIDKLIKKDRLKNTEERNEALLLLAKSHFETTKPILKEYISARNLMDDQYADLQLSSDVVSILLANYLDVDVAIAHLNTIHKNGLELLSKFDKKVNE